VLLVLFHSSLQPASNKQPTSSGVSMDSDFSANMIYFRESPSIYICKYLMDEQAKLAIYDPKVDHEQMIR